MRVRASGLESTTLCFRGGKANHGVRLPRLHIVKHLPAYPGMATSRYRSEGERSKGRQRSGRIIGLIRRRRTAHAYLGHAQLMPAHLSPFTLPSSQIVSFDSRCPLLISCKHHHNSPKNCSKYVLIFSKLCLKLPVFD